MSVSVSNPSPIPVINSLYDIKINGLNGSPLDLSAFKGKKVLFVNVASHCGYTPQYRELQKLHENYPNLVVIGVPCNQFGNQERGSSESIQNFCETNYAITFPMTEKIHVRGANQHPLYKWLTSATMNGLKSSSVKWNFQKYLVDEDGQLIDYYYSITRPLNARITKHL